MSDQPSQKTSSYIQTINKNIFGAAIFILFTLLLVAIVAMIKQQEVTLTQLGIAITVRKVDLLLVLGMILAELTAFDFYLDIVIEVGEDYKAETFSLAGMLYILFLNVLLFLPELFSARVLLIAALLVLVTIKNGLLSGRLKGTKVGDRLALWHNNTKWGFFSSLGAGIVFFLMFNKVINGRLLPFFIAGDNVHLKESYYTWIPACFYVVLFFTCLRAFIRNKIYFQSAEFQDTDKRAQAAEVSQR